MTEIRELRRAADLSQHEFATWMSVPVSTLRMWDSGSRPVPTPMLQRARAVLADHARQAELLPLDHKTDQLASPDGRELVEKHAPQLDAYAAAWKKILPSARIITGLHAMRAGTTHWRPERIP